MSGTIRRYAQDQESPVTIEPTDFDQLVWGFGLDLVCAFQCPTDVPYCDFSPPSLSVRLNRKEKDRLDMVYQSVKNGSSSDWSNLFKRMVGDESAEDVDWVPLCKESIGPYLAKPLVQSCAVHSAILGRLRQDRHDAQSFYLAIWERESYELVAPLTMLGRSVHSAACKLEASDQGPAASGVELGSIVRCRGGLRDYEFVAPLHTVFDVELEKLSVEGFSPVFTGDGGTYETALEDFGRKLDAEYQLLRGTRPVHRDERQDRSWRLLCRYVDREKVEDQIPLVTWRVGRVVECPADGPRVVQWEEDDQREQVPRGKAPDEFLDSDSFGVGTRFEAEVASSSRSDEFLEILRCRPIGESTVTDGEFQDYWRKVFGTDAPPRHHSGHE